MNHTRGFTLIELLVVLSISAVIIGSGIARYSAYNRREQVKQAALTLKSNFRLAQTKAISAEKPNSASSCSPNPVPCCSTFLGERLSFTSTTFSIRPECVPEGLVGTAQTVSLSSGVRFSTVPQNFTFLTQKQTTNRDSDQTIDITNDTDTYRIVVTSNGNINDLGFQ